ncbi:MAG: lipoate--protein ligase [Bacteroidetes bacterium]|nr:lipoate--protein ligase [Bacteroidota bacterium]
MKLIHRNITDPYFNIAAEEYFLKNYTDDIIMFWQSSPSVIVGKHQNTIAEVNMNFVNKNNIPVIRRITGGGTVYHDEGNINYSIITSSENKEKLVDFRKFTEPIIGFLHTLGLIAVFEGKNNLTINSKKFSGNSAHVFKNRVLHHGTILFNTDIDNLKASIREGDFNISDKSVKSIRANVANIADQLTTPLQIEEFIDKLTKYFIDYFKIESTIQLTDRDITSINELVENKYKSWDWNYGYSPSYNYKHELNSIKLNMRINKGIIENIDIGGNISFKEEICDSLLNVKYEKEAVEKVFTLYQISVDDLNLYMMLFGFY